MKKGLIIFALALIFVIGSIQVVAEDALTDKYEFDITMYNAQIKNEQGLIIDKDGSTDFTGKWSIIVLCEKVGDGLYKVVKDAYQLKNESFEGTLEDDQIIFIAHSQFSSQENADTNGWTAKSNHEQKNASLLIKKDTYLEIKIQSYDTDASGYLETPGKAVYYSYDPTGTEPDDSTDPADGTSSEETSSGQSSEETSSEQSSETASVPESSAAADSDSLIPLVSDIDANGNKTVIIIVVIAVVAVAVAVAAVLALKTRKK